jgi:hypothetical protein
VEACATAGTDYADLSGEVLFIRDSIDRCHGIAVGAGARIVHSCGFDSVPSDLGTLLLHHAARADDAGDLQDTTLVVTALKGGLSGGTLASMLGQQDEMRASAERRRVVRDPYALSPDRAAEPDLGGERDLDWVRYDGELRMWVGPFVMAGFNTRVVRHGAGEGGADGCGPELGEDGQDGVPADRVVCPGLGGVPAEGVLSRFDGFLRGPAAPCDGDEAGHGGGAVFRRPAQVEGVLVLLPRGQPPDQQVLPRARGGDQRPVAVAGAFRPVPARPPLEHRV